MDSLSKSCVNLCQKSKRGGLLFDIVLPPTDHEWMRVKGRPEADSGYPDVRPLTWLHLKWAVEIQCNTGGGPVGFHVSSRAVPTEDDVSEYH